MVAKYIRIVKIESSSITYLDLCRETYNIRCNMWGSDQKSSIESSGIYKLVKGIRDIEQATKYEPGERRLFKDENSKRVSLRKV